MTGFRQGKVSRELLTLATTATLSPNDVGKTVCNVGATGTCTFTLPNPSNCEPGGDILFLSCVDQTLTVTCDEKIITLNNVAADSVSLSTSSEKAGGGFLATCVGAKWHICPLTEETQTVTVATD